MQLYIALKQIRLFRQFTLWKAFKVWKRAVNTIKMAAARNRLKKQLFLLSPVFQSPLQQFHMLCHELSSMRVHNLKPGQVGLKYNLACAYILGLQRAGLGSLVQPRAVDSALQSTLHRVVGPETVAETGHILQRMPVYGCLAAVTLCDCPHLLVSALRTALRLSCSGPFVNVCHSAGLHSPAVC